MTTVASVPGITNLSASDLRALKAAADKIGIDVDWLATVISFESAGTFSPSKLNQSGSNAFGIIQFLPKTAAALLGYPNTAQGKFDATEKGKKMSFSEQLEKMVIPYYKWFARPKDLNDTYLAVFYPAAMGKPSDYRVATFPSLEYEQNKGFDKDGKGYFIKSDITRAINNLYAKAVNTRIKIPGSVLQIIGGIIASAGLFILWKNKEEAMAIARETNTSITKFVKDKL
jgi:hypothetical protein